MWTAQNQSDYDKTSSDSFEQAQIENTSAIEAKKFNIGDIVCALGVSTDITKWQSFKVVIDYVENFAIGGLSVLTEKHLLEILESLESDDLISLNKETERYITNF